MEEEPKRKEFVLLHEELSFAHNWKLSSRVKFVSVDHVVAEDRFYLALGTHTGSIYIFERITNILHHLTTLIKEEGIVNIVKFSQNGKRLACALNNGHLVVFSVDLSNHQFECIRVSVQHKGRTVQAMTWGGDDVIYSGDETGFVSVTFAPSSKSDFMTLPSAPIQNLSAAVVQMDYHSGQICVSTEKSVSLFDIETRTFCTVGSKTRQGKFGACFASEKEGLIRLMCARPGYRIWQTNGDNIVTLTHLYKSFSSKKPSRIWGMPLKTKTSGSRSGVFKYLRTVGNGLLAVVDVLGNFYFLDFVAQDALDVLPCPVDLSSFSITPDGQIVLLLGGNRICLLHFAPPAVALNLLATSTWTSDAVEYVINTCSTDKAEVMKHLEPKVLAQLLENAGEADPHYEELVELLRELKAQRQETLAELENRVKILGLEVNQSPKVDGDGRDETRSDTSETSFNSYDVFDGDKMAQSQKTRGVDLLLKVRTKLKETSSRVKAEVYSERAQHLMRRMKDTTSKMKVDAEQLIKSNIGSPIVNSDVDRTPEDIDETDHIAPKVQRKSIVKPALNFVELEAAVFICWEASGVRFVNDELQADLADLSESGFNRFKAAIKDFQAVLSRQINLFHFHLNPAPVEQKSEAPRVEEKEEKEENGEENEVNEEEEERERIQPRCDVECQTVSQKFWTSFPTPVKVQELCSRIAVLSLFVALQDDDAGNHEAEENPESEPASPMFADKGIQVSVLEQKVDSPPDSSNESELTLLRAVETEFERRKMYADFGFMEAAFIDLIQPLHADLGFWRSCLQTMPLSRRAFAKHLHSMRGLLNESVSLYKGLDCSSMEFINLVEKAIVSEKLLGLFLVEIFFSKQPRQALRFSVQNSVFINFRDVFNLLSYHQHLSLWTDYVRQMREKEENSFITTLRSNDDLFLATVMISGMQDSHGPPRWICESCDFKLFLSPALLQSKDHPLRAIFTESEDCWSMNVGEKWLLQNGHWTSYCHTLVARKRIHLLLLQAFNTDQRDMLLALPRFGREDLLTIVSLMLRNQEPCCPMCGHRTGREIESFSWAFIGDQITTNLPPSRALQLLSEIDIPNNADCAGLFRRLLNTLKAAAGAQSSFRSLPPTSETIGAQCSQDWGKLITDHSECRLCGGLLVARDDEEIVINPCCQHFFHASCLPSRDFCVVCLK